MEGYTQAVLGIDLSLHIFKELSSAIFPYKYQTMYIRVYMHNYIVI